MHVVYAELVLLDNWLIDFILLALSYIVLQRRVRVVRCALGALAGGAYSCIAFAFPWMSSIFIKLAAAVVIVAIASPERRLTAKFLAAFLGAGLLAGGAALAAMYSFNIYSFGGVRFTLIGIVAAFLLGKALGHSYPRMRSIYELNITLHGEQVTLKAGVDTGNKLRDALGRSVIVVDSERLLSQLTEETRETISQESSRFNIVTASGLSSVPCVEPERIILANKFECQCCLALAERIRMDGCNALLSSDLRLYRIRGEL